jgi:hypothetical protein
MSKRVKKRNALVHFMLITDATKPEMPQHLQPSIYDVTERGFNPRFKYGLRQIEAFRRSFGKLVQDLHRFANELWKRAPLPPISQQPATHPPPEPHTPDGPNAAEREGQPKP